MIDESEMFLGRRCDFESLKDFGFCFCEDEDNGYLYTSPLGESGLLLTVLVDSNGKVYTSVTDSTLGEYTLHLVKEASGNFVGKVKMLYGQTLKELRCRCFPLDAYVTPQARQIIDYIATKYGNKLEYLWENLSDSAIWRRADNKKWYGILMHVRYDKLVPNKSVTDSDNANAENAVKVEVVDLRIDSAELDTLADGKNYLRGYHMNKRSWLTIVLDGRVDSQEIFCRIDNSYRLAVANKGKTLSTSKSKKG